MTREQMRRRINRHAGREVLGPLREVVVSTINGATHFVPASGGAAWFLGSVGTKAEAAYRIDNERGTVYRRGKRVFSLPTATLQRMA